jgi:trigger factor
VSFTVPSAEFEQEVAKALQNIGRNTSMKGFRPGKVPANVVEKAYGENVRREAVQHFLNQAYQQAIEEHELEPATHPHVHVEELVPIIGGDLKHTFELELRPEFDLVDYKGLEVEGVSTEVSDEELEGALEDIRRQNSRPEPAGDDGLDAEGMAICKVELTFEDEVLQDRDGMRLSPKTPLPGTDPETFEKAMTGATEGAVIEHEVEFPEEFDHEKAAGNKGSARVTLEQVFRIVPPTDEDLWKLVEAEDDDAFRVELRKRVGEFKERQESARLEGALLEQLIELHPFDLPEKLVASQMEARVESMRAQMAESGASEEQLEEALSQGAAEDRLAAEKSLRALFLIEAIAKREELEVTEEDFLTELAGIAQRNQASLDEVKEYYGKDPGLIRQLGTELLERKVRTMLRENATVQAPSA